MRLGLPHAQEGEEIGELDVGHPAPRALERGEGQGPDGGLVDGVGGTWGRDFGEEGYRGVLLGRLRRRSCRKFLVTLWSGRWWELGLALSEERDDFAVLWARGVVRARQEGQEAVSTLEGRGNQAWAGVVLVAPEAGADEVEDRVGPLGPEGRREVIGEMDARDLAEEGAVKGDAWATCVVNSL